MEDVTMQQQSHETDPASRMLSGGAHYLELGLRAWGVSTEVFLRREFGARYLGPQAAAVLVLIPLYCLLCPPGDMLPMWYFYLLYMVMCVVHAGSTARRRHEPNPPHSFYPGWPRLMRFFPRWDEMTVKKVIEPVFGLAVGLLIGTYTAPLGVYLMIGVMCSLGSTSLAQAEIHRRAQDMNDGALEQEAVVGRFRQMRGDRF
jgi:hypothetical protein